MPFQGILAGIVLLGVVIFVHELGHFLVAKWRRVKVLRFSMGFGPAMFKFRRGETEYRVAWFPLGGYVQMAGDSPDEDGDMPSSSEEFLSHPWYGRLMIAAGGPAANLVTAFVVRVLVGLIGVSYPDYPNTIGSPSDTSAAHRAGLRADDRIVSVNGTETPSWVQIFMAAGAHESDAPLQVAVARGPQRIEIDVPAAEREAFFSSLDRPAIPAEVGAVVAGMPAYKAGIKEGDRILAVDGQPVSEWEQLPVLLRGTVDQTVVLRIERDGQQFDLDVVPMDPEGKGSENARIGIEAPRYGTYVQRYGVLQSLDMGVRATVSLVRSVYGGMWLTISRPLYYREYVGGPIFIAQAASQQADRGLDSYLQFLAMINIAIMAFNLLPLPLLDGGHIVIALLEGIRRQALSAKSYLRFQKAGLLVMGTLLVLILANDPLRLLQRQRALGQTPTTSAPQETTVAPESE